MIFFRYKIVRVEYNERWFYALERSFLGLRLFTEYKDLTMPTTSYWWRANTHYFKDCLTPNPEKIKFYYDCEAKSWFRKFTEWYRKFTEWYRKQKPNKVIVNLKDLENDIAQYQLSGSMDNQNRE